MRAGVWTMPENQFEDGRYRPVDQSFEANLRVSGSAKVWQNIWKGLGVFMLIVSTGGTIANYFFNQSTSREVVLLKEQGATYEFVVMLLTDSMDRTAKKLNSERTPTKQTVKAVVDDLEATAKTAREKMKEMQMRANTLRPGGPERE